MDFFEQQDAARRTSRRLILWYLAAVAFVVASYCAVAAAGYALLAAWTGAGRLAPPAAFHAAVAGVVGGCILAVSAYRRWQLGDGGPAVAYLLGACYVDPAKCSAAARRLLNVVEEMAIASGVALPPVYLLEREPAVNALVAGYSPSEAVIVVTEGALQKLSRDELQGVMGHEFSHILNGDMALNVRLAALLAGLSWLGEQGERLVYAAAREAKEMRREERGAGALLALFGALVAFTAFPGTFAAEAVKARISRQRELLADAASVQFTRNPDGIAGALDSILALNAGTTLRAVYCGEFSHMFFAPAIVRWWGFASHPPIEARIRHANPRFMREEYRATRHGRRREVAVLDDAGDVVKHVRAFDAALLAASVGRPRAQHVDFAARLLGRLPSVLRDALREGPQAELAMFALALEAGEASRAASLAQLESRRGAGARARVGELHVVVGSLARNYTLTLADLAVPAIKAQKQKERDRFLADLTALVEADARVTLREFVLATLLRQRLREGAGEPIPTRYRAVAEIERDAHLALSLVALAGRDAQAAFEKGAAVLGLGWRAPLGREALTAASLSEALERLRHLLPFAKPALLKACLEAAGADGVLGLAEVELVRMVAATLDCPVPPLIAAQDPLALAA